MNRTPNPWLYFALVFGWSWLFWLAAILIDQDLSALPVRLLQYAGGIGPPLAALLLISRLHGPTGWQDLWRRVFQAGRIGGAWWLAVLLVAPLVLAVATYGDRLLGGQGMVWTEHAVRFVRQPLAILPVAFFLFVFGPLPEELGWRGYALPGLQLLWSALGASLFLGAAWALWHLPLFWITGTYQHELGVGTPLFWQYIINIVAQAVLMTWIYNNTQESILSAILFHFVVNFCGELVALTPRAGTLQTVVWVGAAITVVLIWGPRTLAKGVREAASTSALQVDTPRVNR